MLNEIKHSETIFRVFAKIHFVTHPNQTHNIDHILIPEEQVKGTRVIHDRSIVHHHLSKQNEKTLSEGKDSFPASQDFRETYGDAGEKKAFKELLSGDNTTLPRGISPNIAQWLLHFRYATDPQGCISDPIMPEITAKQFRSLMKRTKEMTALSPLGIHMGHYIAASYYPELSGLFSHSITLPFEFSFAPQ